jgi:hypothetical protein
MFLKLSKKPWRNKSAQVRLPKQEYKPDKVVSVNQMVSQTAGLVAQMTGILTLQCYKYATVFVDQALWLGYLYVQTSANAVETLKGKHAFEMHAKTMGITIQGHHADNGIFRAHAWVNYCSLHCYNISTFRVIISN